LLKAQQNISLFSDESLSSLKTIRYSFSGHETFPFRYAWLTKGVQKVQLYSDLFVRDDAMVILGVGKNMVRSIRHWCEALNLIEASERGQFHPTKLGYALLASNGWDPYLEDPATLWLLHWLLVSRQNLASTWYLAFTRFNADIFTRDDLANWIQKFLNQTSNHNASNIRVTLTSLHRDVEVFLRTYLPSPTTRDLPSEDTFDCPLIELNLLKEVERGAYQFIYGYKSSLPQEIFLYALTNFWQTTTPHQATLSFETILHGSGSPGMAFKLSENALVEYIEHLPRWSGLTYDDTAGMRLVLRHKPQAALEPFSILRHYYERTSQETLV
jgi:hypothetical protein